MQSFDLIRDYLFKLISIENTTMLKFERNFTVYYHSSNLLNHFQQLHTKIT